MAQLVEMGKEIASLKQEQNDTANFLKDKKVVSLMSDAKTDFHSKYGLTLPLMDMATFKQFDQDLTTNQFLKHDVVSQHSLIQRCIIHNNYSSSILILPLQSDCRTTDLC